jgi:hypothetical protein
LALQTFLYKKLCPYACLVPNSFNRSVDEVKRKRKMMFSFPIPFDCRQTEFDLQKIFNSIDFSTIQTEPLIFFPQVFKSSLKDSANE